MFSSTANRSQARFPRRRSRLEFGFGLTLLAAWVTLIAAVLAGPGTSWADDGIADEPAATETAAATDVRNTDPPLDLEEALWRCDHAAARYGNYFGADSACTEVAAALKAQKFGGDFEALLAWWQQQRNEEYAARDRLPMP